eukprot:TRINITY_DN1229_c0_g1_i1.p1 TRINITY_DN1229_c0_g1~~TRINITY_DN1229_c0_g1_i1.p1  ORF type:complete len:331 (-),score=93.90 TRINITY_DN1229_c0_g1_i1:227-1219(-)
MAARRLISSCLASPLVSVSTTTSAAALRTQLFAPAFAGSKANFSTVLLTPMRKFPQTNAVFAISKTMTFTQQKRCFANAPAGTPSSGDVQTILKKSDSAALRKALESDTREKISLSEYLTIAAKYGFSEKDAKQLALSFTDAGVIMYLPNSTDPALQTLVHLKPQNVFTALYKAIDFNGSRIQTSLAELQAMKEDFERKKDLKDQLDDKAHRAANRLIYLGGAWLFVQAAVLARMTWWEFSWDIVEPITYFVTFTGALIGYLYFATTKSEYTYEDLRDRLARTRREKFYERANFDPVAYQELAHQIHEREVELQAYLPASTIKKQTAPQN